MFMGLRLESSRSLSDIIFVHADYCGRPRSPLLAAGLILLAARQTDNRFGDKDVLFPLISDAPGK
jgi:hypothetical protein